MSDAKTYIHKNAEEIIEKFGGIRPMATKLGIAATTVQGWKKRGIIPAARIDDIIKVASQNNIDLSVGEKAAANKTSESKAVSEQPEKVASITTSAAPDQAPSQPTAKPSENISVSTSSPQNEEKAEASKQTAENASVPPAKPKVDVRPMSTGSSSSASHAPKPPPRKAAAPANQNSNMGAWISAGGFAILLVVLALYLMPAQEQTEEMAERIAEMEAGIKTLEEKQTQITEDVSEKESGFGAQFEALKQQAGSLGTKFDELSTQTQKMATGMISEDELNKWRNRLENVEGQLSGILSAEQMESITQRFQFLQETESGQEQLDEATGQLSGIVDSLDGRMDLLDEALIIARDNSTALGETFDGVPNEELKAGALLLALNQFRGALNRGETPFEEDLQLLYSFVGEENEELRTSLDKLAPQAENGVLTVGGLSSEFRSLAGDIVVSSLKGEDVSIQERAQARLNNVLKIEKNGEPVTGTKTQKTVEKTQELLDQGNLNEALFTIQQLDGDALSAASPFIEQLEASIAAQDVQGALNSVFGEMGIGPRPLNLKNLREPSAMQKMIPKTNQIVKDDESGFVMTPNTKKPF